MDPTSPSSTVQLDPATAAGQVSLRFERWFAERELDLPAETRAEFIGMGMQALQRWPDRSSGDVLDELIAELDERLAAIADEEARSNATAKRDVQGGKPQALRRLFGGRSGRTH